MTHRSLLIFSLFLLLFAEPLSGQMHPIENVIDAEDGMPSNETYASFFDKSGDLYILTDQGLVRYNGIDIKVYTKNDGLPATAVFKHYRDYKGRDWLSTKMGICYLENGKIVVPAFNQNLKHADFLHPINNLYVSEDDSVFVVSEKFAGGYFAASLQGANFHQVKTGLKFIKDFHRISDRGLVPVSYITNRGSRTILTGRALLPPEKVDASDALPKGSQVLKLAPQSLYSCKFQLLTNDKGKPTFYFIDKSLFAFEPGTLKLKLLEKYSTNILYITEVANHLLVCTRRGGITCIDLTSGERKQMLKNFSIAHLNIFSEHIWYASTLESGVIKINTQTLPLFSIPDYIDLNQAVRPFYCDGEYVSIVQGFKFYQYKRVQNQLTLIKQQTFKTANRDAYYYQATWVNKDSVVFGGHSLNLASGKTCFNGHDLHSFKRFRASAPVVYSYGERGISAIVDGNILWRSVDYGFSSSITSLEQKNPDSLYAGTQDGLYLIHLKEDRTPSFTKIALQDVSIESLLWYKNTLVVGTNGQGVFCMGPQNRLVQLNHYNGLSGSIISKLLLKGDTIWVATNNGLHYIHQSGEANNWNVSTKYSSGYISDLYSNATTVFFKKNHVVYQVAAVKQEKPFDNNLLLSSLEVEGENRKITNPIRLTNNQNSFLIRYRIDELLDKQNQLYQYRLLGLDTVWRETGERSLEYQNLDFGQYSLQIKGRSASGKWTDTQTLNLEVVPLFYQKAWFAPLLYVVAGLLMGLLVFAQQVRKSNRLKQRNLVLQSSLTNLKLQINPHFIFNALNSLQYLVLSNKTKESAKFLSQFSQLVREILNSSQQQFSPMDEEIERLKVYVELEETRLEKDKISFVVENNTGYPLNAINVPSLLLQPIVENAIWHGFTNTPRQPEIKIKLYISTDKKLTIEVIDNGVGIDLVQMERNKQNGSLAVRNIEERLYLLSTIEKANFSIHFEPIHVNNNLQGTKVIIILPLKTPRS
jgi:anti-sigma regulatory factor (Ser/Thr protein kinase)